MTRSAFHRFVPTIVLALVMLPGCLWIEESFTLEEDLSGRVVLVVRVPANVVPPGEGGDAAPRLRPSDIALPEGVTQAAFAVERVGRQVQWTLTLDFVHLERLASVRLRLPGTDGPLEERPWKHLRVLQRAHSLVIERPAPLDHTDDGELRIENAMETLIGEAILIRSRFSLPRSSITWKAPTDPGEWQESSSIERVVFHRSCDLARWIADPDGFRIRGLLPLAPHERFLANVMRHASEFVLLLVTWATLALLARANTRRRNTTRKRGDLLPIPPR